MNDNQSGLGRLKLALM